MQITHSRMSLPTRQVALTEGSLGLHQAQGEGLGLGQLTEHLGDFVVAAADDGVVVDGFDAIAHAHSLNSVDDAALLDPLQGLKVTCGTTPSLGSRAHLYQFTEQSGSPLLPPRRHLDEGVAGPVVRDGQPQGVLRLRYLHLLGLTAHMRKDKVLQPYLASQEFLHIHFVAI